MNNYFIGDIYAYLKNEIKLFFKVRHVDYENGTASLEEFNPSLEKDTSINLDYARYCHPGKLTYGKGNYYYYFDVPNKNISDDERLFPRKILNKLSVSYDKDNEPIIMVSITKDINLYKKWIELGNKDSNYPKTLELVSLCKCDSNNDEDNHKRLKRIVLPEKEGTNVDNYM